MEQLVNLLAILIACFSIGDQGVAWWKFQTYASRSPEVRQANQLSFGSGILMMITILSYVALNDDNVTLETFVLVVAAVAELVGARLMRKDMARTQRVLARELDKVGRLEAQLRIMQRTR